MLDSFTKGTGASVVPLEDVLEDPGSKAPPRFRKRARRRRRAPEPPPPREPRRFRVVDALSRKPLADDVAARDAVAALAGVRSVVDVSIFVWEPATGRWRPLTHGEKRVLWTARDTGRG